MATSGMTHLVYGYLDPRTDVLRYIGKSSRGLQRPRQFVSHSNRCLAWIKSLAAAGLKPTIVVLEELPAGATFEQLNAAERRCIAYARSCLGADLTNLTDGGDGSPGFGFKRSPETKARMSAAQIGNTKALGRKISQATKDRLSAQKLGESNPFFGKKHTETSRAKMGRAGRSNPFYGKKHSAATRAKMRAAKLRAGRRSSKS